MSARPPLPSRRGARPPRRARPGAKAVLFVLVFAGLVGMSYYLRASHKTSTSAAPVTRSSPPVIVQPSLPGVKPSPAPNGGPPIDSPFTDQACRRAEVLRSGFTLQAAFLSNGKTAADWEDALSQGSLRSELHGVDQNVAVAVCYIDGPWQPPPPVTQYYSTLGEKPDRGIMFVTQPGQVIPGPIAPHASLPILRPAD